jgi:hypothetical protein
MNTPSKFATHDKVPLQISWLQENGLLQKAGALLGYAVVGPPTEKGTMAAGVGGFLEWDDYMLFNIAQLIELGFEIGTLSYCPHCKKLKADCDQEAAEQWARNHEVQETPETKNA